MIRTKQETPVQNKEFPLDRRLRKKGEYNMYLMNYNLYANEAQMMKVMAEDAGAPELRNPVFYIRTEYKMGKIRSFFAKMKARREALQNSSWTPEIVGHTM